MNQFDQAPVNGEAIEESIAIVCNGNTAPKAIAAGQYLFIKNHSTLATGGYHATAAIASGDTLSSSNVTSDPDGIANAINGNIPAVVNNLTSDSTTDALSAAQGKALNSNKASFETTTWTPNIPRATVTIASGSNKAVRVGDIVFLSCRFTVTASQTSNSYIGNDTIPKFGKTPLGVCGTWFDNTGDKSGTLASYGNSNIWFGYQGGNHPLTDQVGHDVSINITYGLV